MRPPLLSLLISVDPPSYWTWSPADIVLLALQLCADGMTVPGHLRRFFAVALVRLKSVGSFVPDVRRRAPPSFRRGSYPRRRLASHGSSTQVVGGLFVFWGSQLPQNASGLVNRRLEGVPASMTVSCSLRASLSVFLPPRSSCRFLSLPNPIGESTGSFFTNEVFGQINVDAMSHVVNSDSKLLKEFTDELGSSFQMVVESCFNQGGNQVHGSLAEHPLIVLLRYGLQTAVEIRPTMWINRTSATVPRMRRLLFSHKARAQVGCSEFASGGLYYGLRCLNVNSGLLDPAVELPVKVPIHVGHLLMQVPRCICHLLAEAPGLRRSCVCSIFSVSSLLDRLSVGRQITGSLSPEF